MKPAYTELVGQLIRRGAPRQSRYGPTLELVGLNVEVEAGEYPRRPGLNPAIGLMEGFFLIGGFFAKELIAKVAPKADLSLFTLEGAYGPRVVRQLPRLIEALDQDRDSRQHLLYVAQAGDQYRLDTPCTTSLQFLYQYGRLNLVVSMRSWDVVKGLPTDLIQFGMLLQAVTYCLDLMPGTISVTAGSGHLYTQDAMRFPQEEEVGTFHLHYACTGSPKERFHQLQGWTRLAASATWKNGRPEGVR